MELIFLLLLSCGDPGVDDGPESTVAAATSATESTETAEAIQPLDDLHMLTRISLDLRGVRPSIQEIQAVESDPALIDTFIEEFMQDDRFGDRVVSLFSEIYQTQSDNPLVSYDELTSNYAFMVRAMGEEPLRIIAHIAENDLPYYKVVTADWTMADEYLAEVWPLDYPSGKTGWQQSYYTDDRPAAGVLSTNSLWWRYATSFANANRGRANAISRILLCSNYLTRPIEFDRDVNLLDEGAINEALKTNDACMGCHSTLDPLASYLWGFYYTSTSSELDVTYYHPEREYWWVDSSGVGPEYYGTPSYTLEDLGQHLAADPRLPECAAETIFEQLLQRQSQLEDFTTLTALRQTFLDNEMTLRSLIGAMVRSDEYRSAVADGYGNPWKITRPDLLASQIEALTGYRFTYNDYDMMTTDGYGLRVLAGGIDGGFVTAPAGEVNATMSLSYERLAQAAAWYVVQHDKENPDQPRLFSIIGFTENPDANWDAMAEQLQLLHLVVLTNRIELDGPEVAANIDLWRDLYEVEADPAAAWAGVLSVLFRDPEFLFY